MGEHEYELRVVLRTEGVLRHYEQRNKTYSVDKGPPAKNAVICAKAAAAVDPGWRSPVLKRPLPDRGTRAGRDLAGDGPGRFDSAYLASMYVTLLSVAA